LPKNSARRRGEKDKLYYDGERDESHVLQSLSVGCRVNNKPHATDTENNLIPPPRHLFLLKNFVFVGDHAQITDNHRVVNVELVTIVEYHLKKYLEEKMPNNIQNGECCTPAGCMTIVDGITSSDGSSHEDGGEIVKVLCNNEHCPTSGLMHRQCFDQWEASVLHYLRSCGRARSWSERQRSQNLWTKKGYDLAFKVN
jgi:hypothetical protein